ncbi:MAG TPA: iron-sulfur cluster assembly accessory protein [Rhodospirillum rubrum]|nr:iron-sulfur cluster assembly accessory protein [Rhodospirillum rubrum]
MMTWTESAAAAVRKVVGRSPEAATGLRLMVSTGAVSYGVYRMGLEARAQDDDAVIDLGEAKVFVDPQSLPLLDGARVDFVDSGTASGFVFDNPNALNTCSCGKSFSAATC